MPATVGDTGRRQQVQSLGQGCSLASSSTLASEIPWTEVFGRLQSTWNTKSWAQLID